MVNNPASLHAVPAGLGAGQVGQESTGTWCSVCRQPALTHTLLFPELEGSSPLTSPPSRAPTMANTLGCFCLHPEPLRLAGGHPGGWCSARVWSRAAGPGPGQGPGRTPAPSPSAPLITPSPLLAPAARPRALRAVGGTQPARLGLKPPKTEQDELKRSLTPPSTTRGGTPRAPLAPSRPIGSPRRRGGPGGGQRGRGRGRAGRGSAHGATDRGRALREGGRK